MGMQLEWKPSRLYPMQGLFCLGRPSRFCLCASSVLAFEGCGFHKEVVYEELAPHVDRYYTWRRLQIWYAHGLAAELLDSWRPLLGKAYAVVEQLPGLAVRRKGEGSTASGRDDKRDAPTNTTLSHFMFPK